MTQPDHLPTALPVAIATALLLLILAPLLGGGAEPDACRQVTTAGVGTGTAYEACD